MALPTLVAFHAQNGVHAFNVLTAALRADERTRALRVEFAKDRDEVVRAVREAHARGERPLVGWSFYSPESAAFADHFAFVRAELAGVPCLHLCGGVHASAEPRATLALGFDLVAVGEGESTLIELVVALADGRDPREVPGLGWLEDGLFRTSGPAPRLPLDTFPAFNVPDRKWNAIEITRGCIYACAFCQTPFMFKARFRHRSVADVRRHVAVMRREKLRYVRFVTPTSLSYGADDVTPDLAAVEELLVGVREEIGKDGKIFFGTFPSEVRPEHVTPEALALLKRHVDNDNLVIGGQSGSQRVLDATRRDHSVDDVVRAVRLAAEAGFRANVDFLFGLPGEDAADVDATVELMRKVTDLGGRVHTHTFMPLPGTPLKDAPPGVVAKAAEREIGRLEAQGRSYGHWRKQLVTAERLARRRG